MAYITATDLHIYITLVTSYVTVPKPLLSRVQTLLIDGSGPNYRFAVLRHSFPQPPLSNNLAHEDGHWAQLWYTAQNDYDINFIFSEVRYMSASVRLSVVCRLQCNVRAPYSGDWNFVLTNGIELNTSLNESKTVNDQKFYERLTCRTVSKSPAASSWFA